MAPEALSPAARAFRVAHGVITGTFLVAIGYVWWCALTRRRDVWVRVAVSGLVIEGAVVAANHGDCPLGPLQDQLGDPVPLFELLLSPRAAKRAVPVLGAVAATGLLLLMYRSPDAARLDATSVPQ
jgi:hypothetical protein